MTYQNDLYVELARIGKSLSSERRLEIMDLLVQGPKTVEKIAELTGMSVANASRHLQVLRGGNLVLRRRDGNHIYYRPASSKVVDLFYLLRDVGADQLERIRQIKEDFEKNDVYAMSLDEAYDKAKSGEIELIDVRPADEYATAHIAEARNIPLPVLKEKLDTLPADKDVVVYCRGNLCTYATRAARILSESGYNAHSLNESTYDWNQYIEKEGAGKNEN